MTLRSAVVAALLGCAVPAAAGGTPDPKYAEELAKREPSGDSAKLCAVVKEKLGEDAGRACRITRNFLEDLKTGADKGRFPPGATYKFARDENEKRQIVDKY